MSLLSESKVSFFEAGQVTFSEVTSNTLVANDISHPFVLKRTAQGTIKGPVPPGVLTPILDAAGNQIVLPERAIPAMVKVNGTVTFTGDMSLYIADATFLNSNGFLPGPITEDYINAGCARTSGDLVGNEPGVTILSFEMGVAMPAGDVIDVLLGYY